MGLIGADGIEAFAHRALRGFVGRFLKLEVVGFRAFFLLVRGVVDLLGFAVRLHFCCLQGFENGTIAGILLKAERLE